MLNPTPTLLFLVISLGACATTPDAAVQSGSDPVAGSASPTAGGTSPTSSPAPGPTPSPAPAAAATSHHRCGWLFSSDPVAAAAFTAHADWFDAVHPVWFALQPDGVSVKELADVDDPALLEAARAHHVAVIPLVASVESTDWTRAMLKDPNKRAAHIKTLVTLAMQRGYDGLDLDYEHLWDAADHDPLAAFIDELSAAMRAAGKQISMAVPALDAPSTVWDYAHLGAALDRVHVMAYDFHTLGSAHAGPTSPLGWIDAVGTTIASAAGSNASRFLLGLPNYGVGTSATCQLGDCAKLCTGPITDGSDELSSCNLNEHHYAAGTIHRCETAQGTIYFDDAASIAEKAQSARAHGLGGVGYWNAGGEPSGFFEALKSAVP